MPATNDVPRPVNEWKSVAMPYKLTKSQQRKQKRGESIYERDKVVEKYSYSKGEWV